MNSRLNAIFACPFDHLSGGFPGLDRTQTDLTKQCYPGIGKLFKIRLNHAFFNYRRTGQHFHPGRPEIFVPALRGNRHCFEPDNVFRAARRMHLASRDHRCHPTMQTGINPVNLLLARRVIANHRMHMAVNQPRRKRHTMRIDNACRLICIKVMIGANRTDTAINGNHTVSIDKRFFQLARQNLANIFDHKLLHRHNPPPLLTSLT